MSNSQTRATLTADQKKGADAFFKFLLSNDQTFVLSGGAGVGKTYLMKYLSNDLMKVYENSCRMMGLDPVDYEIHYTATTNKAAEVLENAVNSHVRTIHSFLGLKVTPNFKTGKEVITETKDSKTYRKIILFIDESSMIDQDLYEQIIKRVKNSKIIFVGDKAQLAPVNEDLSPVYKNVDQNNFVHLTQSVRNAGSPALMNLCAQLRNTVETGTFYPIHEVPGHIEYLDDVQMQAKLQAHFYCPNDEARILCYTNSRVDAFNEYIRELRQLPPEIVEGDTLVTARAYAHTKAILSVEREVTVLKISPEVHSVSYGDATPDGEPLTYREVLVKPKAEFLDEMYVRVPCKPADVAETMQTLKKRRDYRDMFEIKNGFADLRGKEACTVYKSQGSTYDTVFLDLGNIGISYDPEQVARMLFVGASRATTKVYLYGRLPAKYTGRFDYDPHNNNTVAAE